MCTATYSSGVANVNTCVVLTDGKPTIATDNFVGIEATDMIVNSAGTVQASKFFVTVPIAWVTRIRGRGKTKANIDTDTELLGILWDTTQFDLTSGVYTIDDTTAQDTAGLVIRNGNIEVGTLDVVVDGRVLRADVA